MVTNAEQQILPPLPPLGNMTFAKVSSAIKFKITTGELPQGYLLGYGYTSTLPKAMVWLRHPSTVSLEHVIAQPLAR